MTRGRSRACAYVAVRNNVVGFARVYCAVVQGGRRELARRKRRLNIVRCNAGPAISRPRLRCFAPAAAIRADIGGNRVHAARYLPLLPSPPRTPRIRDDRSMRGAVTHPC